MTTARRLPIGAEVGPHGVAFRVWAPRRRAVEVVLEGAGRRVALEAEVGGYFSGLVPGVAAGARYRYQLDGEGPFPDPASRFQPEGPHGFSQVVDGGAFAWTDADWPGVALRGQVIYEMHVGTFTREGTWAAASRELDELQRLGVSVLEVMPIAEFPGRFGWGYDGVGLFAPTHLYGDPDDLRRFVDRAHAVGLGVILDVVYNHLGPDGNYLSQFAEEYFSRRKTEWGEAINFDGPGCAGVRELYTANAGYWISEYHLDGLRLDATQSIIDASNEHIVTAVTRAVRRAAGSRATIVVAENEPQEARLARPAERGGFGLDALWNDDFHHSAVVALTGRSEAYYSDHAGAPQEFVSALRHGFLFQGQHYAWQEQRRGTPALDLPPERFVLYLENHDQVANSGRGERLHQRTDAGRARAMAALVLLAPGTPMLFQGEEFASTAPFFYFADHDEELAREVCAGRAEFLSQFPSVAQPDMQACVPDPADEGTFAACRLDFSERERHRPTYEMYRDLLRLRRTDEVVAAQGRDGIDGAVLGGEAFLLRLFGRAGDDRLLLVNLGRDLHLLHAPEPLLAPPEQRGWALAWSSEDPRWGGSGTPPVEDERGWHLPGHATVMLAAKPEGRRG